MSKADSLLKRIAYWFTVAALLTASFDEVLVVELGTITLRFSQLFIVLACGALFAMFVLTHKHLSLPVGAGYLAVLLILNAVLCFFNPLESLAFQLGYEVWFILCVALTVLFVNLFQQPEKQLLILRLYIGTFFVMAVVCIVQVILGIAGFNLFAEQYLGNLPRADAFMTEPSYYACFALPGWVFLAYELEQGRASAFSVRTQKRMWIVCTLALVFATSRMGLLMMGVWLLMRVLVSIQACRKDSTCKQLRTVGWMILWLLVSFAVLALLYTLVTKMVIENSWGFGQRITHLDQSKSARLDGMIATLQAFWDRHIWVGASLGGVFADVMSTAPSHVWQVANLCAELLCGLGIPGFLVLLLYLVQLIRAVVQSQKNKEVLLALLWGLIWQLAILQFNANGLRLYLWINLAMISMYLPVVTFPKKRIESNA